MKILCFSDVHLDEPSDPINSQRDLFLATAEWIGQQVDEHKPDLLVNLGDTNHRDGGMTTGTIKLFHDFFEVIQQHLEGTSTQFWTVIGNHDQHTRNGALHVMEPLKWVSNVADVARVETIAGKSVLFAPYRREQDQYFAEINAALAGNAPPVVAFTHMDVVDAKMNSGVKSSHGIRGNEYNFPIFNGHYHQPQTVGNVIVIGAPMYTQYRDIDAPGTPRRGALLIEIGEKRIRGMKRLTNPHTKLFAKFKGTDSNALGEEYNNWVDGLKGVYDIQGPSRLNAWFVGPKATIDELRDFLPLDLPARLTPDEKVRVEETNITLDLSPEKAVEEFFASAKCGCGEEHSLEYGKEILRAAEAYLPASRSGEAVVFQRLTIKDFMSIGSADLVLEDQGLVLIEGVNNDDTTTESNGSGKSSIAEALLWVLFDKTSRGIKADEVIRRGASAAAVDLLLTVGGKPFQLRRERKKGKPVVRITSVDALGVAVDATPHDARECNELIERLVGVSFEQFLLMVVMAQGFDQKFSGYGDTDRKEMLESFLGIEVYDAAKNLVSRKVKDLQFQRQQLDLEEARQSSVIANAQASLVKLTEARESAMTETAAIREKLESDILSQEKFMSELADTVRAAQTDLTDAQNSLKKAQEGVSELRSRITKGETLLTGEERAIADLQRQFDALEEACYACGQPLPEGMYETQHAALTEQWNAAHERIATYTEKLDKLRGESAMAEAGRIAAQGVVNEKTAVLTEAQTNYVSCRTIVEAMHKQHKALVPNVEHFDNLIAGTQSQHAAAEEELVNINSKKVSVDTELHECDYWSQAFDPTGIRSIILRTVVNYVNEYLHEMCVVVTGGNFLVQLSSTKELKSKDKSVNKLDIVITPDGSYKAGSGGERRKIDLLLNLAVAKLAKQTSGFSSNIIIADEVLDNLDLMASQHVLQVFEDSAKSGMSVFLISHNPSVKPLIPNVWTVVKNKGVSEVRV